MNSSKPAVLVRCAACGHNFETRWAGGLSCPTCRQEIWLEPSADLPLAPEPNPASGASPPPDAQEAADPPPADNPPVAARGDESLQKLVELGERLWRERHEYVEPAWEQSGSGILRRFVATVRQVVRNPVRFFAGLSVERIGRAWSFGWVICTLAAACFAGYGLLALERNTQALLDGLREAGSQVPPDKAIENLRDVLWFSLLASPVLGALNLLLSALAYHLGVWLAASKSHRGFRATFRATAYGFVPLLLMVVPVVGHLLGTLWSIALQVVAIAVVHRIGLARAALAVLLPATGLLLALAAWMT